MGTYALSSDDEVLSALVDRVMEGETVAIVREGVSVAELRAPLQPAAGPVPGSAAELIERDKAHAPVDAASAELLKDFNADEEE